MAAFLDGRITEAVGLFGRIAALFEDSGDLLRVVTPRSTRGHGLVFHAEPEAGLAETSRGTAARDRSRDAPRAGLRAVAPVGGPLGTRSAPRGRGRRAGGAARRPGGRAPRLDRDRVAGARHRPAGPGNGSTAAAAAFGESAQTAGETLTLFASWAAARCALVAVALGRLDDAERAVHAPWRPGRRWATTRRDGRRSSWPRPAGRTTAPRWPRRPGTGPVRAGTWRRCRVWRRWRVGRDAAAGMAYAPTRGGGVSRGPVLSSGSPPAPSQSPASAHWDGLIGHEG